jgi:hypothetical protein
MERLHLFIKSMLLFFFKVDPSFTNTDHLCLRSAISNIFFPTDQGEKRVLSSERKPLAALERPMRGFNISIKARNLHHISALVWPVWICNEGVDHLPAVNAVTCFPKSVLVALVFDTPSWSDVTWAARLVLVVPRFVTSSLSVVTWFPRAVLVVPSVVTKAVSIERFSYIKNGLRLIGCQFGMH